VRAEHSAQSLAEFAPRVVLIEVKTAERERLRA